MPQFKQVDVFTSQKYMGNPVAVFFSADQLSTQEMVRMSTWTNLSETTFVVRPTVEGADYHVRIFSLAVELPFAGHPTIGTCHALLEAGLIKPTNGKIYQQCQAGLVELTVSADFILFKLPRAIHRSLPSDGQSKVQQALGVATVLATGIYDVGPVWLTATVPSAQEVIDMKPDMQAVVKLSDEYEVDGIQVIGAHQDQKYEVRTFNPIQGIIEDPACGSGAGATAAHLRDTISETRPLTLVQGTALNRAAELIVNAGNGISVGGNAVTVIDGTY